jgi:ABC-type uncharacterized transport system ATPase subunit
MREVIGQTDIQPALTEARSDVETRTRTLLQDLLNEYEAGILVTELIRKVSKGRTILMVEHNLGVVSKLCDTITVLQRGAVLTEGDYATVSSDPRVKEAYMGKAA